MWANVPMADAYRDVTFHGGAVDSGFIPFQRGEPLLFESLVKSPVKKLWMMPQYHGGPDTETWNKQNVGDEPDFEAKWFDHWLNGADNGIENFPPVNLYTMGAERWEHLGKWPLPNTYYTRYYLDADGKLGAAKPAESGRDTVPLMPASSPCSRMTAQWMAGLTSGPCDTDNSTWEATGLTYTTAPLEKDVELTGLVKAAVYAELTSAKDATLVAVLSDVDPASGQSNQVSAGFLLASQRAFDRRKSWYSPEGDLIRPWHPFTRASQQPVTPNEAEEYQIEIYPTSQVFKKGHQLRLTIGTANTPATTAPVPDMVNELGTITLLHGPAYPSNVLLPVIGPPKPKAAVKDAKAKKKATAKKKRAAKAKRKRHHRKRY